MQTETINSASTRYSLWICELIQAGFEIYGTLDAHRERIFKCMLEPTLLSKRTMADPWNMPHLPFYAQDEPSFNFPDAIKAPLVFHDPLAAPAYPHGNENRAPPPPNAPLHQWPHQPPAPPRAQPQHQHTFIQYHGPDHPAVPLVEVDAPPLQAVPSAVHGNGAGNFGKFHSTASASSQDQTHLIY